MAPTPQAPTEASSSNDPPEEWSPFLALLKDAPDAAVGDKMVTDTKDFVFGSTEDFLHGLCAAGGLKRSMEQEFAQARRTVASPHPPGPTCHAAEHACDRRSSHNPRTPLAE
jgi:hypothetical protein